MYKCCISVRLVQTGASELEGRLEVYHDETWGTICDDGFSDEAAQIACNALGFGCVLLNFLRARIVRDGSRLLGKAVLSTSFRINEINQFTIPCND